ncbi:TlpA family protein disulfide reductase [Luteimonas granuli]|uniref:TlpA family protein disulfide reductase n=1 Tax=Luteimonas granuli TaxID=1176533 RepID=A0A518N4G0_9GAMM|nr:TlpA family protein disulfide reductase [Luteimonas granuli]
MTGVGPFPIHSIMAAAATVVGWLVVRGWARRLPCAPGECPHRVAVGLFVDAVMVGLLAARLGYILLWWPEYMAAPKSIVAIGDGGFLWWAGLPAALAFAWWRTRKRIPLRRPLLAGIAAGMLAWAAFGGLLMMMQRSAPPLPAFELATLDGEPVTLADLSGRPMVLNLWATWCPPCRREMPVLEDAQRRWPGVAFVLVNQGEDRGTIREYLDAAGLELDHVLLDPHSQAMLETGTRGLPTTLFFNAEGRLVDSHMGELTRATLAGTLRKRFGVAIGD